MPRSLHQDLLPHVWVQDGKSLHSAHLLPTPPEVMGGVTKVKVHWDTAGYASWVAASAVEMVTQGRRSARSQEVQSDKDHEDNIVEAISVLVTLVGESGLQDADCSLSSSKSSERLTSSEAVQHKKSLPSRSSASVFQGDISRGGESWSNDETRILVETVEKIGPDWHEVAAHIPGRSHIACRRKFEKLRIAGMSFLPDSTPTLNATGSRPRKAPKFFSHEPPVSKRQSISSRKATQKITPKAVTQHKTNFKLKSLSSVVRANGNEWNRWTNDEIRVLCKQRAMGRNWNDIALFLPRHSVGACDTKYRDLLKAGYQEAGTTQMTLRTKKANAKTGKKTPVKSNMGKLRKRQRPAKQQHVTRARDRPRFTAEDIPMLQAYFRLKPS